MTTFLTEIGELATDVVGYLGTAAVAALAIFAVVFGVRYVIKMFKSASK